MVINMEFEGKTEFFKGGRPGERRIPRGDPERTAAKLKKTPYYWWYQCLKKSDSYRECCRNQGKGRLGSLYDDFGDVFKWPWEMWAEKFGRRLFVERKATPKVEVLSNQQITTSRSTINNLIVNVPLTVTKRKLVADFKKILNDYHKGRELNVHQYGTSRRPLLKSRVQMSMVELLLAVYEEKKANKKMPLWRVGENAGVKIAYGSKSITKNDSAILSIDEEKRRMAIVTSGYYKKACWLIDNAENGLFPLTRKPTADDYMKARLTPPKSSS
jgi:hypothetical protein